MSNLGSLAKVRATSNTNAQTSGASGEGEAPGAQDETRRPHGTRAGAERHRYNGELLCAECLEAERDYYREYRRSHRRDAAYLQREAAGKRRRYRDAKKRAAYDRLRLVDDVAVDRAVGGERVTLNRAERLASIRRLRDRGLPYTQIAERLGVTERQVHRDLAELGLVNSRGAVA